MACRAITETGCSVCLAGSKECRCVQVEHEIGEYVNDRRHSGSRYVEKTSSGTGARDVRPMTPPGSPVDTLARSNPAGLTGTSSNSPLISESIGAYSTITNFRDFQDDNSYHFPSQPWEVQQLLTPPSTSYDRTSSGNRRVGAVMSPGRADCLQSIFSLAWPSDPSNRISQASQSYRLIEESPGMEPDPEDLDDPEDPENVRGAVVGFLWLDRYVESNSLPFVLQAYATWITRFLFEPRMVQFARRDVFKRYALGEDYRRTMDLLANNVYEITRSADFDPGNSPNFFAMEVAIRQRLTEASTRVQASRELDMMYALGQLLFIYELISSLLKVGSLPSVISIMHLVAPVFRRACPGSLEKLINLPALFASLIMPLQYYSTVDVLLSVVTGRPMFFRYEVEFTQEVPESLFSHEDSPGLRWTYGVPDRLTLTFAQMNALLEDFGPHVPKEVVDRLENDIERMEPIVGLSTEPFLSVARVVVQQCWFLAGLIYLYMGLSGADSTDPRVAKARARFMRILASVKPKRNPDSFLVLPMVILGVATDNPVGQDTIRRRMLGVTECSRHGTVGNEFVRILDHIWAARRPVVWSDLRRACWELLGV